MNGKRNPWEGVNLLPFIDAQRMRAALALHCPLESLTAEEAARNAFGAPLEFVFDPEGPEAFFQSCNPAIGLPDLPRCRTKVRPPPDPLCAANHQPLPLTPLPLTRVVILSMLIPTPRP